VNDGFATVESPNVPSPFRSHEYEIVSPASGSDDPEPSKFTVSGATPLVGVPEAEATGGVLLVPPVVYVAVKVPGADAVMLWVAAPPSDHEAKVYVVPPSVCVTGALRECTEPLITVDV
jgi:hypothetical protein